MVLGDSFTLGANLVHFNPIVATKRMVCIISPTAFSLNGIFSVLISMISIVIGNSVGTDVNGVLSLANATINLVGVNRHPEIVRFVRGV